MNNINSNTPLKPLLSISLFFLCSLFGISQNLIPYRVGDEWGYANDKGEIVIQPKYQEAGEFWIEVTWVKKDGKYGYIDKEGGEVTGFDFDEAGYFSRGVAAVTIGGEKFCIDLQGEKIEGQSITYYGGGCNIRSYFQCYYKNKKYGIKIATWGLDENGESQRRTDSLPTIWDDFRENGNGLAAVKKDSLWGVIDRTGKLIVDYQYDDIQESNISCPISSLFRIKIDNKYGFLNEDGSVLIEPIYAKAEFFRTIRLSDQISLAKVWLDDHFWGYIDETGREYFERNQEK